MGFVDICTYWVSEGIAIQVLPCTQHKEWIQEEMFPCLFLLDYPAPSATGSWTHKPVMEVYKVSPRVARTSTMRLKSKQPSPSSGEVSQRTKNAKASLEVSYSLHLEPRSI